MMDGIFLLLGSNMGDKKRNLIQAKGLIERDLGQVIKSSELYKTAPWGNVEQDWFINQALEISTHSDAGQLLSGIHSIENELGRIRANKWDKRPIDIDILYFAELIINQKDLAVPHPEITNRRFTLVPLCDIAPDFVHPANRKNQRQLLEECEDQLEVIRFDG